MRQAASKEYTVRAYQVACFLLSHWMNFFKLKLRLLTLQQVMDLFSFMHARKHEM